MALRRPELALISLCVLSLSSGDGCSGSNEPSVMSSSSATAAGSSSEKPSTPAAGGSSGASKAGSAAPSGGSSASAGVGGKGAADTKTSTPAAMNGSFSPLCSDVPPTAAGMAPAKGGACGASDPQTCYKTCGPLSVGFKSETCTSGAYVEQTGCTFPDADYACYKIPATVDASCPKDPPQATMPCDVAPCTVCNAGGNYLDSSGASKTGYCVCPMAGDSGSRKWSCASNTAWPCPSGRGC